MQLTNLFLSYVATSLLIAMVDGAASINPTVFCSRIEPYSRMGPNFKVCATASFTSPSPAALANGTTIYAGGYSTTYSIVKGLSEGEMFMGSPENDAGIVIGVVRDDSNVCVVSVTMNGNTTACKKCRYCGDESFRADCSNIKYGRMMNTCESAEDDDVFFPLMAVALPKVITPKAPRRAPVTEPRVVEPRRAPVKLPRRTPIRAPVMGPRRAPIRAPRRPSIRAPVNVPRKTPVSKPI